MSKKRLQLPVMQCDDHCGDCCGVVPATEKELKRVTEYAAARGIVPADNGTTCPFYQAGRCAVYDVRPWVCRTFGHTEMMTCSRGHNTNALTVRQARRQARENGMPTRTLHDALGEGAGALAIMRTFKTIWGAGG